MIPLLSQAQKAPKVPLGPIPRVLCGLLLTIGVGIGVAGVQLQRIENTGAQQQQAAFLGGAFWYSSSAFGETEIDLSSELQLRNPLARNGVILLRALASGSTESSIFAYDAKTLINDLPTRQVQPLAVGPPWHDVMDRSVWRQPVPRITSLYRGPGYATTDGEQTKTKLWIMRDNGFKQLERMDHYKGLVGNPEHGAVVATENQVRVDGKTWAECNQPNCRAFVDLGLDWVAPDSISSDLPFKNGLLALGYADQAEIQHICVLGNPKGNCTAATDNKPGNLIDGRQPLFSDDGRWLAIARQIGPNEGWQIHIFAVKADDGTKPILEHHWTSGPFAFYGEQGAGGDYLAYKGSYGWSGDRLYYLVRSNDKDTTEPLQLRRLQAANKKQDNIQLPQTVSVPNPFACDASLYLAGVNESLPEWASAFQPGPKGASNTSDWTWLFWAPPASGSAASECDETVYGNTDDASDLSYQLRGIYAVAPFRLGPSTPDYLLVQALIGSEQSRKNLERVLLFQVEN
jgi:hypothetical protein